MGGQEHSACDIECGEDEPVACKKVSRPRSQMAPGVSRRRASRSQSWQPAKKLEAASQSALEDTISVADLDCMAEADADGPSTDPQAALEARIFNKHSPLAPVGASLCPS